MYEGGPTGYWVCLLVNLTDGAKTTEIIMNARPEKILVEKNHQNKQSGANGVFVMVIKVGPFADRKIADLFHRKWSKQSRGSSSRMKKVLTLLIDAESKNLNAFEDSKESQEYESETKISIRIVPYTKSEMMATVVDMKDHPPVCIRKNVYDSEGGTRNRILYELCSDLIPKRKLQNKTLARELDVVSTRPTDRAGRSETFVTDEYRPKIIAIKRKANAAIANERSEESLDLLLTKKRKTNSNDANRSDGNSKFEVSRNYERSEFLACSYVFETAYPNYYRRKRYGRRRATPSDGLCLIEESGNLLFSFGDMTVSELFKIKA